MSAGRRRQSFELTPFPEFKKLDEYMAGIKDITDKYNVLEFNLEKSAALMTEAGFTKNEEGFWVDKDGVRPDANLYARVPLFGDIAPIDCGAAPRRRLRLRAQGPAGCLGCQGRWPCFHVPLWSWWRYHRPATIPSCSTTMRLLKMGEQDWGNITRWQNADFKAVTDEMNKTAMDDPKMKDLFQEGHGNLLPGTARLPGGAVVPPYPGQHRLLEELAEC